MTSIEKRLAYLEGAQEKRISDLELIVSELKVHHDGFRVKVHQRFHELGNSLGRINETLEDLSQTTGELIDNHSSLVEIVETNVISHQATSTITEGLDQLTKSLHEQLNQLREEYGQTAAYVYRDEDY
jgi:methyl-accepting chemotaxis protein